MRKSAPYSSTIDQDYIGSIYLFVGNHAWAKAKAFSVSRPTLCLPPFLCPFDYDWPVADADILIFDTGYCDDSYIEDIAICLYSYKAKIVRSVAKDFSLIVFKKDI